MPLFCLDAELSVGLAVVGRPDLAPFSPGGGVRQRCVHIWGLERLGAPPRSMGHRRRLHSVTGVYCDSIQSHCAKGPFQLMVVLGSFFGGGSRRRGGRPQWVLEGSSSLHVLLFLFRVLLELWVAQLPLYPTCTCLYSYARLFFLD